MTRPAVPKVNGHNLLLAVLLVALQQGCERIDPVTADSNASGEAVSLTCESCHTSRDYLRLLAVEDAASESAGGG